MTLPAPTIVIFDMDGTTVRHINVYLLHILERLDDAGYVISRFWNWLLRRDFKTPIIEEDDLFLKRKKPRLLVHRALHHLRRKEVDQIVEPCPGIYVMLEYLKRKKIPMALVSNGLGTGYGHDILDTFDLEKYFETTIFREDITKSKPHPEPLLKCLAEMDVKPKKSDVLWYIGDRRKDILAAIAAQDHLPCKVVPIAYALNAATSILEKQLAPEHIIMSYGDMYRIVKKCLRAKK